MSIGHVTLHIGDVEGKERVGVDVVDVDGNYVSGQASVDI